jgi:hypothetical protein
VLSALDGAADGRASGTVAELVGYGARGCGVGAGRAVAVFAFCWLFDSFLRAAPSAGGLSV